MSDNPLHNKDTKKLIFMQKLPNRLTLARIAIIPVILILYPLGFFAIHLFCGILFSLAALTDYFDGYIARKYKSTSQLGMFLDPIADKMLTATALIVLAYAHHIYPFIAGVLICRDLAVNGMRLVALEKNMDIKVNDFGKLKTVFLSVSLGFLLAYKPVLGINSQRVGMIGLWIALILSLYSGWLYLKTFLELIKEDNNKEIEVPDGNS